MDFLPHVSLKAKNTFALPGHAEYFCAVENLNELHSALEFARHQQLPLAILGGGSNTVVNGEVPGLVIGIANSGLELVAEDETSVTLRVAAGENWHQLVMTTLARGWYGLENLALIPGCAGAAPIQNIGAYGVELTRFLVAVEVIHISSGEAEILAAADCKLAYRDSIFKHQLKGRVVIWSLHLKLAKTPAVMLEYPELANAMSGAEPTPMAVASAVIALRRAKLPDPAVTPNAGSFFKNPVLVQALAEQLMGRFPAIPHYPQTDGSVKFPAAWLIDRAGWKGVRDGHVGVHDRQALVLIHHGDGSGGELLAFAARIAADVKAKFGVELEMEPVVLGAGGD